MKRALGVAIVLAYAGAAGLGACGGDSSTPDASTDGTVGDSPSNNDGSPTDGSSTDTGPGIDGGGVPPAVTVSWGAECALMANGTVWCWGPGANLGQPYDASASQATNRPTPLQVLGLPPIKQIGSAVYVTCALSQAGDVYCWGDNNYGEVGVDGSDMFGIVYTPRQVTLPAAATAIDVGYNGTCAQLVTGDVYCFGHAGDTGVYGIATDGGAVPNITPPTQMAGAASPLDIALGFTASCVLFDGGEARCVGSNGNGEMGTTAISPITLVRTLDASAPVQLSGPGKSIGPTAGITQCAVLATGGVQCWGGNGFAVVAPEDAGTPITTPQAIAISNATSLSVGAGHACAIDTLGDVYCWGQNDTGGVSAPLDSGTRYYNPPYKVQGLPGKAISVSAGGDLGDSSCSYCAQSCAFLDTGDVYCWGSNVHGRLGRGADAGTFASDPNPARVNF